MKRYFPLTFVFSALIVHPVSSSKEMPYDEQIARALAASLGQQYVPALIKQQDQLYEECLIEDRRRQRVEAEEELEVVKMKIKRVYKEIEDLYTTLEPLTDELNHLERLLDTPTPLQIHIKRKQHLTNCIVKIHKNLGLKTSERETTLNDLESAQQALWDQREDEPDRKKTRH